MATELVKPKLDSTEWGTDMNNNLTAIEERFVDLDTAETDVAVLQDEMVAAISSIGTLNDEMDAVESDVADHAISIANLAAGVNTNAADLGFHDRGNVAAYDWVVGDFITDGAHRDLDLSGIVPLGTTLVMFRIAITDNLIGSQFRLRTKDNPNQIVSNWYNTRIANVIRYGNLFVAPDADRLCQYWASNTTWTTINLTVAGWWKGG